MNMQKFVRHSRGLAIALAVFVLFGAAVGLAGAQRPDSPPVRGGPDRQGDGGMFGMLQGEFVTRLAQKLGVSEEALQTAFRETMQEMRPQIQEGMGQLREHMRGHMREHMAEMMRDMMTPREPMMRDMMTPHEPMMDMPRGPRTEGNPTRGGQPQPGPQGGMPLGPGIPPQAVIGAAADVLGLQPPQVMEQMRDGRTLADIAAERGVAAESLADQIASRVEQMRIERTREGIRQIIDHHLPGQAPGGQ